MLAVMCGWIGRRWLTDRLAHRLRRRFDNEEVTDEDFENAIELPAMNDMRRDGRNDPFERTRGVIG